MKVPLAVGLRQIHEVHQTAVLEHPPSQGVGISHACGQLGLPEDGLLE
jgi:hypothetical protein